jgi:hypothetical protein
MRARPLEGYSGVCQLHHEVSSCNKAYQNVRRIRPTNWGGRHYERRSTRLTSSYSPIIDKYWSVIASAILNNFNLVLDGGRQL